MKIVPVTVDAAASDVAHPDHDRWVKETTLAMEIEQAKRMGVPLSVAERENQRLLERADRIAKDGPQKLTKKKHAPGTGQDIEERKSRLQRLQERAVTIRAAQPMVSPLKLSPCGRCGTCRACMRERRVLLIIEKSRQGDRIMLNLAWQMTATAIDANGGVGRFATMSKADRDRVVAQKAEDICERSVRWLGAWT